VSAGETERGYGTTFDSDFERQLEGLALVARRGFEGRFRAERRSKRSGTGIEFADHREYAPGDDFRFVDVPLFARSGKLFVKLFEEEEDLAVHVLVDVSKSMSWAPPGDPNTKLLFARRIAAGLAYITLSGLDRVSISALSDGRIKTLPHVRGKARIHRVLEFLAREDHASMGLQGTTDLAAATQAFVTQTKKRGLVILLSDFYADGIEEAIDRLRHARFEVVVLHLWDADEASKLGTGDLEIVDRETGARRQVTMTPETQVRFREAQSRLRARVGAACRSKQVLHIELPLERTWDDAVLRVLARGGLVA
jgi:uncharacterized protein (DUF58 family)